MQFKRIRLIVRWSALNTKFFSLAFAGTAFLVLFFPHFMLSILARWASLLEILGARGAAEFSSTFAVFSHVLQRNAIAAAVFFGAGLLLQAPIALLFAGTFYSLIAFLAQHTLGRSFAVADWVLIIAEAAVLVVCASLSTAIAAEVHGVSPSIGEWWRFSKKSWTSLRTKAPNSWRAVLPAWYPSLAISAIIILSLLLFLAYFEVFGY